MSLAIPNGPTRFGAFVPPFHRVGISPTILYKHTLELIEHADRLGFHEFWIGEHHTNGFEPIGSPELFLAAASQRTSNIMLGTGVSSLPYHNPLLLASRMTQLDHLSKGRAIMGFGPGQLASDAHVLGLDPSKLRSMMLQSAEVISRLMHGEWVTIETEWFKLRDAHLVVRPYQLPTLEMVVAAMISPSGPITAGRLGLGLLNLVATTADAFDALRTHWDILEAEAETSGKTVTRDQWRLSALTHIAETKEQARKDCEYGFQEVWGYLSQISPLPKLSSTTTSAMIDEAAEMGLVVIGTPETLVDTIDKCTKQTGGFGTWITTLADFASPAAQAKCLELIAEYVIPHYRGQFASIKRSYAWAFGQKDGQGTIWKSQTMNAIKKYQAEKGTTRT